MGKEAAKDFIGSDLHFEDVGFIYQIFKNISGLNFGHIYVE